MKLLLDTHTLLWFIEDSSQLSSNARNAISTSTNQSYYSLVTIWELSIKISLGKLKTAYPINSDFETQLADQGFQQWVPTFSEFAGVQSLPFHHNDPFDRLLISQALSSNIQIVSKDAIFDDYNVNRLW